jgi:hypothetical protein
MKEMRMAKRYNEMSDAERLAARINRNREIDERSRRALTVDNIVKQLHMAHRRASYGAVAACVGGIAVGVMTRRPKSRENSWVVAVESKGASKRGWPTGYKDSQIDPECLRQIRSGEDSIIDNPDSLRAWFEDRVAE